MKRVAIIVLLVASSACSVVNKGGARGPNIAHTNDSTTQPASDSSSGTLDTRPENR